MNESKLTHEEFIEWSKRISSRVVYFLNLESWKGELSFFSDPFTLTKGSCKSDTESKTYYIRINEAKIENVTDLFTVLVHEHYHVVLSPFDTLIESELSKDGEGSVKENTKKWVNHTHEVVCYHLAESLTRMFPEWFQNSETFFNIHYDIVIDIDGVITEEIEGFDYPSRTPKNIDKIKEYLEKDLKICFYTSRRRGDSEETIEWLEKQGLENIPIYFGKPLGKLYIDDKSICDFPKDKRDAYTRT